MDPTEVTRGEVIAGELMRTLKHGCSNHWCSLHIDRRGIGTNATCTCLRYIYELSLELACELEPIKNRRGMRWEPLEVKT